MNKVLFIARRFPPSVGGMERFAFDLSNALVETTVHLFKITWGGSNKWLPLVLPMFFIRAAWTLSTNRNIEVIHIQDAVQAPLGWLLHVIFRRPYVVIAHGLDITYQSRFYQAFILPYVRRADAVISISSATKDEVDSRGVDQDKSYVITLGTQDDYGVVKPDREKLGQLIGRDVTGKLLVLTTGRLVERKGVAWFIENVLPTLLEHNTRILYLVAGEGRQKPVIQEAIDANMLSENVVLLGRVSDEVRMLLYQSSDIFVMPNVKIPGDMEGFGIVAHEAATAGLPVVASNLEGIADALRHGKNGILVEPANAKRFISEIEKLIESKTLRKRTGKNAREYTLREYGWGKIAVQYVSIYNKISKRKRTSWNGSQS